MKGPLCVNERGPLVVEIFLGDWDAVVVSPLGESLDCVFGVELLGTVVG